MEHLTVELELVKAISDDLKQWSSDEGRHVLKHGQMIFIRSQKTDLLEGPYVLGHNTDTAALAEYLMAEMLYVPVNNFDSKIPIVSTKELNYAS